MNTEQPIPVLDDLGRVQSVDTKNMLRLINDLPEQCETALGIGRSFVVGEPVEPPSVVFISGAGVAGTGADMAAAAVSEFAHVPVVADHCGPLPRFVTENALVILIDYTGNSPSALRVYKEARQRKARLVCVTSGGKLREMATRDEVKIVRIPPGQPARTAIGYLFVPVVALFEQMGLAEGLVEKLSYGIMLMKNVREALRFENPTARNAAKQIALSLVGRYVVVCGSNDYRSVIAHRWADQIGANGKTPAFVCSLPDSVVGPICGLEMAGREASAITTVLLKDSQDRTEVPGVTEAVKGVLVDLQTVDANIKGATTIEKIFHGLYMADYVSYYVALASEVDPTPLGLVKQVEDWLIAKDAPETPSEGSAE